ncbi:MAG: PQQ-binding-like beta-propeller repeat protein, partial [Actinomycetota bacterium]
MRVLRALVALSFVLGACSADDGGPRVQGRELEGREGDGEGEGEGAAATTSTTAGPPPAAIWSDPAGAGAPYPGETAGLLTFRGNPSRTYYGEGPVPSAPRRLWSYPLSGRPMCGLSTVGGETREWCGTGWTGQPAVFERDGRTMVAFGAYDHGIHLVDAADGRDVAPPFQTGDIIKGSVTIDPDGFPLLYSGSRDNFFRVLSFEGGELTELWSLAHTAVSPTKWNSDWDGAGLVLGDYLLEGGENSQFHVVKLNRARDADGVRVSPQLVFNTPAWDDQLLADLPDENLSIESSVAVHGSTVYWVNSGGLVQGWDLAPLDKGGAPRQTFRFWAGDDADASVVVDADGMLYVAVEWDRETARAREVGQLIKLDPSTPDNPLVWAVKDQDASPAGFWATPAIAGDLVIAPTNGGRLLGIDRATGEVRWSKQLAGPTWSSPVVVDDVLIEGDCEGFL